MNSIDITRTLSENHEEVVRRWLEGLHGQVAEDLEDMMRTPMGNSVAGKLLACAVEYLGAEAYEKQVITA